jgi:hypothetical protein
LTVALASALPVSVRVLSLMTLSVENAAIAGVTGALVSIVPLSVENAAIAGERSRRIDDDVQRTRGGTGIAGHIGGGGGQAVAAVGERGRRIGPVAAAVGGGAAEQRGAVIDLSNATRFRTPTSVSVLSFVM